MQRIVDLCYKRLRTSTSTLFCLYSLISLSQADSSVYKLNPWLDAGIIAASGFATYAGLEEQNHAEDLTLSQITALDISNIPTFDRGALRIDPNDQGRILTISDLALNLSAASPLFLALNKGVRNEWLPILTLYIEAATITSGMQIWTSAGVGRIRPIAYIEDATLDQRTTSRNNHSFYSGHTSNTAVGVFFTAKVLDDMHPELGDKRYWLYAGALLPTALVGWSPCSRREALSK